VTSPPATLLVPDRVRTLAEAGAQVVEAVLVEGSRVAATGSWRSLRERAPHARVERLAGLTLVPGFVDPHHHFLLSVLYEDAADCRPDAVPSLDALGALLRAAARDLDEKEWLVGTGYDAWRMPECREPDRAFLDAASPDRPAILIHYSFHQCVVNSRALERLGIGRDTPDPIGGRIARDRRGDPTGLLIETAMGPAEQAARSERLARRRPRVLARIRAYEEALLRRGITRICDPSVPDPFLDLYREAREAGALRLPVVWMPISEHGLLALPWDKLSGAPTGEGCDALRAGPLKLVFDGADRCAICMTWGQALGSLVSLLRGAVRARSLAPLRVAGRSEVRPGRDGRLHAGLLLHAPEECRKLVRAASERGFSLAVHAVGNHAFARALDVLDGVPAAPGWPHRIEHGLVTDAALLRRAADQGIQVVTQPGLLDALADGGMPAAPGLLLLALRSMRELGVIVASSSDAPAASFDPLAALRAAVRRERRAGGAFQPEEAVAAADWLAMATRDAARACGSLERAGTIEPGKRADLVALSRDPVTCPSARLADVEVSATWLAGERVFGAGDAQAPGSGTDTATPTRRLK
jgi:predicted amidohydrolase YtcJ